MNETINRTVPTSIMEMYQPAIAAVMNMVAQGRIGDALPQTLYSWSPDLADTSVSNARLRVSGARSQGCLLHFVWIMVERSRVNGTAVHFMNSQGVDRSFVVSSPDEEDGLCARTNDVDLMVGYPPSYFGQAPVRYAQDFASHVCEFLADNLRHLDSAELLLQIESHGRSGTLNLVTDSQRGWHELHTQPQTNCL